MDDIRPTTGDSQWFTHDRFGLFIHWGLYALPARHEWIKQHEKLSNGEYEKYFKHFDPDLYDPEVWAKAAAGAGMKYFVITTKHHEGFALWDSKLTDYKATKTPYGQDLLSPMVDAFRGQNLRTGFYHSLIDWHHPDFLVDDLHALRQYPNRAELNAGREQQRYIDYLHGQVRELLTEFGEVDVMWFDYSYPSKEGWEGKGHLDWDSAKLAKLVRELQPGILLNDRLDLPDDPASWDIKTPEQYQPQTWVRFQGQRVVWESCQTFSGSWGYHRDEQTWKSVDQLVQMLIESVARGGNLLLNVGPTGRGEFDARALDRLAGIGEWMKRHSRSIYGCTQAPDGFTAPKNCELTFNPATNRLYVHVFAWPFQQLHFPGLGERVEYAQLLNDASEVKIHVHKPTDEYHAQGELPGEGNATLRLPVIKPDVTVPVIELFLK